MRKLFLSAMVMTLASLLAGCQPGEEAEVAETPSEEAVAPAVSDDEAIRQIIEQSFVEAFNNREATALAEMWTPDGDWVGGSTGNMYSGREEIEQTFVRMFAGSYKESTLLYSVTNVRFLADDVALVDGSMEIAGMIDEDGQEMPTAKGLFTNIMAKSGDQWLIVCARPMTPVLPRSTT